MVDTILDAYAISFKMGRPAGYAPAPTAWKQMLGSAVIAGLWMASLWIINRLFLAPWRWLRMIGVRQH